MAEIYPDISNNNAPVDIETFIEPFRCIGLKANEATWYSDPYFNGWANAIKSAGKLWIPYDFARPGSVDPVDSANHFCDLVLEVGVPFRAMNDFEATATDPVSSTKWALAWGDTVAQRMPAARLTFYTYGGFAGSFYPDPALARMYDLIIAGYPGGYSWIPDPSKSRWANPCAPWSSAVAWQYTSIQHLAGTSSNVDMNVTAPDFFTSAKPLQPTAKPATAQSVPQEDEMPSISLQPGESGEIIIPSSFKRPVVRASAIKGVKARITIFGPDNKPRPSASKAPNDNWHVWVPTGCRVLDVLSDKDLSIDVALDSRAQSALGILVEDAG